MVDKELNILNDIKVQGQLVNVRVNGLVFEDPLLADARYFRLAWTENDEDPKMRLYNTNGDCIGIIEGERE